MQKKTACDLSNFTGLNLRAIQVSTASACWLGMPEYLRLEPQTRLHKFRTPVCLHHVLANKRANRSPTCGPEPNASVQMIWWTLGSSTGDRTDRSNGSWNSSGMCEC